MGKFRITRYCHNSLISELSFSAPVTGAAIDYVHDKLNATHSYLVELRPTTEQAGGFLLPPNQIEPTFQEFFNGFIASIKEIDRQNSTKKIDFCKNREHFREILQYLLTLVRKPFSSQLK